MRSPEAAKTKLRYIHRDVDRYGTVRIYFRRRPGARKTKMPDQVGSPEFVAAYNAALAESTKPERSIKAPAPSKVVGNTFRWLCTRYCSSRPYQRLGASTQRSRQQVLDHCCREPILGTDKTIGDMPLDRFNAKAVRVLRDRKGDLFEAANARLKSIRSMFKWAIENEEGGVTANPARDVARVKAAVATDGHHSWTLEEVQRFEDKHPIGTKARLALALLLYTGQRRSDVVQFGRQHVKDGWLHFTQHKNRNRNPVRMELPITPELQRIIDASSLGSETFLATEYGKPFSMAGFGNKMRKWCDEAGLPECSSHGLRKATAARLADLGCTAHEIMAVTGHRTLAEVERYTKAADQRRLAQTAMARITAAQAEGRLSQP